MGIDKPGDVVGIVSGVLIYGFVAYAVYIAIRRSRR